MGLNPLKLAIVMYYEAKYHTKDRSKTSELKENSLSNWLSTDGRTEEQNDRSKDGRIKIGA